MKIDEPLSQPPSPQKRYGVHTSRQTYLNQRFVAPQPPILGGQEFLECPRVGGFRGLERWKQKQIYLCVHGSLKSEGGARKHRGVKLFSVWSTGWQEVKRSAVELTFTGARKFRNRSSLIEFDWSI
jgi:hypothetical protein